MRKSENPDELIMDLPNDQIGFDNSYIRTLVHSYTFSDVLARVRMCLDMFGCVRNCSELFGSVRTRSDTLGASI